MSLKYNFDKLIEYRIMVAGHSELRLSTLPDGIEAVSIDDSSGYKVTVLTGSFDQAGLMGLLRSLYYLGLPLISVNSVE